MAKGGSNITGQQGRHTILLYIYSVNTHIDLTQHHTQKLYMADNISHLDMASHKSAAWVERRDETNTERGSERTTRRLLEGWGGRERISEW